MQPLPNYFGLLYVCRTCRHRRTDRQTAQADRHVPDLCAYTHKDRN